MANDIQNSVNNLITSEANYNGIFDALHTALSSLPAKLSNIRSMLNGYRTIVSNVPANNSYRQSADVVYAVIDGVFTDGNTQALAALEVRDAVIENLCYLPRCFLQPISAAINATLPDGPAQVAMAARQVEVATLSFFPRQTLNEIYSVYTG